MACVAVAIVSAFLTFQAPAGAQGGGSGSSAARAGQWGQFRGPGSRGVLDDPALPDTWSASENVAWKQPIPGMGWSSPVVWGSRVFVTSVMSTIPAKVPKPGLYLGNEDPAAANEHRWMVYALDFETGRVLWEREAHKGTPAQSRHLKNSYASETPITDGERIYVLFGNVGLFAYAMDGTPLWQQRWPARKTRNGWGPAASPVLHDGRLYVVHDTDEDAWIAAVDARTGKEVWRTPRSVETNWSTPFVWVHGGRVEIVTTATSGVRSYDREGKELWSLKGMSSITIPTPFDADGLLYVASGYVGDPNRPVYVVKPGASGDISLKPGETANAFVQWSLPQAAPYNPSPLVYKGIYFTLFDRGLATAHEATTGKLIYGPQRIDPASSAFTASPWAANGHIFVLNEEGDTYVIKAGSTFEVVRKNSLGEMALATPALTRGSIILRTASHVYRIARRKDGGVASR